MAALYEELQVSGHLEAGNIASGITTINPTPDTNSSQVVLFGKTLAGTGDVHVFVTAHSSVPGSAVWEVSASNVMNDQFTLYIYRTTDTTTNVHWFAIREL